MFQWVKRCVKSRVLSTELPGVRCCAVQHKRGFKPGTSCRLRAQRANFKPAQDGFGNERAFTRLLDSPEQIRHPDLLQRFLSDESI